MTIYIDADYKCFTEAAAGIKAGNIVRFGALRYRAKADNTKALIRSPLNLAYWEVMNDA